MNKEEILKQLEDLKNKVNAIPQDEPSADQKPEQDSKDKITLTLEEAAEMTKVLDDYKGRIDKYEKEIKSKQNEGAKDSARTNLLKAFGFKK